MFAIKAEVSDPMPRTFAFRAQKTMYGGKYVAAGDAIFVFASENEGGAGLVAKGVVTSVVAVPCLTLSNRCSPYAPPWTTTVRRRD